MSHIRACRTTILLKNWDEKVPRNWNIRAFKKWRFWLFYGGSEELPTGKIALIVEEATSGASEINQGEKDVMKTWKSP